MKKFIGLILLLVLFNATIIAANELVPAENNFIVEFFTPTLTKIERKYPIFNLRDKFSKIINLHKEEAISIMLLGQGVNSLSLTNYGGDKKINFIIPMAMNFYTKYGADNFEDLIVLSLLHEYYHLVNHELTYVNLRGVGDEEAFGVISSFEKEAWEYTFMYVLDPMIKIGRMKNIPDEIKNGYLAWLKHKKNVNSLDWDNFASTASHFWVAPAITSVIMK